jgi:hypothetical protein
MPISTAGHDGNHFSQTVFFNQVAKMFDALLVRN